METLLVDWKTKKKKELQYPEGLPLALLLWVLINRKIIQSTLGFATMGKPANLCLATRNAVTDLF